MALLRPLRLWLCCTLLAATIAGADTRHFVFGLDPAEIYTVYKDSDVLLDGVICGAAGSLSFSSDSGNFQIRSATQAVLHDVSVDYLEVIDTSQYTITLAWRAPANIGSLSGARYDLRVSNTPLDRTDWQRGLSVPTVPLPASAGERQYCVVQGLEPQTSYHFSMVVVDGSGTCSLPAGGVSAVTSVRRYFSSRDPDAE